MPNNNNKIHTNVIRISAFDKLKYAFSKDISIFLHTILETPRGPIFDII